MKVLQQLEDAEEGAAAAATQATADRQSLEAALTQLHARLQASAPPRLATLWNA